MVALLEARRGHSLGRPRGATWARRLSGRPDLRWPVCSGCLAWNVANALAH
jgi:hypothetical protein